MMRRTYVSLALIPAGWDVSERAGSLTRESSRQAVWLVEDDKEGEFGER